MNFIRKQVKFVLDYFGSLVCLAGVSFLQFRCKGIRGSIVLLLAVQLLFTMFIGVASESTRWCGLDLAQQISTADLVAGASVVSRSTVSSGSYLATFRIDNLLHSRTPDLTSKFLRLRLKTPGFQGFPKPSCQLTAKVKPHTKYLIMLKKTSSIKQGEEYTLVSPPIRGSKRNLRNTRSILCPDCTGVKKGRMNRKTRHSRRHNREDDEEKEEKEEKKENEEKEEKEKKKEKEEKKKEHKRNGRTDRSKEEEEEENSKEDMRLTCSARGNPPPTLYWTMNGELIKHSQQSRIKTKKISKYLRKSVLKLEGPIDSSIHVQCHAYNSYGHASRVKLKTTSTTPRPQEVVRPGLTSHSQFRSTSALSSMKGLKNPLFSTGCPVENYCMNGGSCLYYSDIGELACHCSRGFHGRRCERKYVSGIIKGVKTISHMPICIKGMGHYPCS